MRRFLLFFLLFSISFGAKKIERLESRLPVLHGEAKLRAYSELFQHYITSNPEKALYYAEKAVSFAEGIHKDLEKFTARNNYAFALLRLKKYNKARKSLEENKRELQEFLNKKGSNISREEINPIIATTYIYKGETLFRAGEYKGAIEEYRNALNMLEGLKKSRDKKVYALRMIGVSYLYISEYEPALKYATRAVEESKKLDKPYSLVENTYLMAYIYRETENLELATINFRKSLKLAQKAGDKYFEIMSLNEIGNVYHLKKQYKRALIYKRKALRQAWELDQKYLILVVVHDMGMVYFDMKNYELAKTYYLQTLKLINAVKDVRDKATILGNLGKVLLELREYRDAEHYLTLSLKMTEKHNMKKESMENHVYLARLYYETGVYRKAYPHMLAAYNLKEEILGVEKARGIAKLTEKLEREKINQENLNLKRGRNMLLAAMGFIILVAFTITRLYYQKKKTYRKLLNANKEIKEKQRELNEAYRKVEELSRKDPLTNLPNRRDILEKIMQEKIRHDRSGISFALIMADIDDFKVLNDQYGHDCGDAILVSLAQLLMKTIRRQDLVGRWGGEEFLFLLPETDYSGSLTLAEKIRKAVEEYEFNYNGMVFRLTITLGVAVFEKGMSVEGCIKTADQRLYEGKKRGKNAVVAA